MKRTLVVLLILLLIIGSTSLIYAVDDVQNNHETHEHENEKDTVNPTYIPHPCHSGISCAYCDRYCIVTRSCGCEYHLYKCCCGKEMPLRVKDLVKLCPTHAPYNKDSEYISTKSIFKSETLLQEIQNTIDEIQNSKIISPMYKVIHICHTGPDHRECEWWKFSYKCGCVNTEYHCCCGKRVSSEVEYCDEHFILPKSIEAKNITLMYEAIHPCHTGLEHKKCEKETFYCPGGCGCYTVNYNCCCGKSMSVKNYFCDEHENFGW
ncbi:hypothetical protein [Caloranaerobacter sp. DY30410]|uniref:hypothetical protein n=1 Tax=Caloranaerobacter sp. DY30410 TaxID=3238305 RepID=UPI003D05B8FE